MLTSMWIDHKATNWRVPTPRHSEFEHWRTRVFVLRARMLAFVQQILAFATVEVLEPNWRKLEVKLAKVQTVDQLLRDHVDFLDTCLKECMLTSSKLLRVRLRVHIVLFHDYLCMDRYTQECWLHARPLLYILHILPNQSTKASTRWLKQMEIHQQHRWQNGMLSFLVYS